jgi:hypothetical protein
LACLDSTKLFSKVKVLQTHIDTEKRVSS